MSGLPATLLIKIRAMQRRTQPSHAQHSRNPPNYLADRCSLTKSCLTRSWSNGTWRTGLHELTRWNRTRNERPAGPGSPLLDRCRLHRNQRWHGLAHPGCAARIAHGGPIRLSRGPIRPVECEPRIGHRPRKPGTRYPAPERLARPGRAFHSLSAISRPAPPPAARPSVQVSQRARPVGAWKSNRSTPRFQCQSRSIAGPW